MKLIKADNISKIYKEKTALNKICFELKEGEIVGLVGANGAGKSTLLKILSGLVEASDGMLTHLQKNLRINAMIEDVGYYGNLTASEHITALQKLGKSFKLSSDEILSLTGLIDAKNLKVKKFSLGMKQRLGLAMALYSLPNIIILDEPTNGLDPKGIADLREIITKINNDYKITFIISSHNLDELSRLATSYLMMKEGRLICNVEANKLNSLVDLKKIIIVDDGEKMIDFLDKQSYIYEQVSPYKFIVNNKDESNIIKAIEKENIKIIDIQTKNKSIEQIYFDIMEENNVGII